MSRSRAGTRAIVWPIALASLWVGLLIAPEAAASCAGPQLSLIQDGRQLPQRREGTGENEKVLYDVAADLPITVVGSNLTLTCDDMAGRSAGLNGCSAPAPPARSTVEPMDGAQLVLAQASRRWTLAAFENVGTDLTAEVVVDVPTNASPGPAEMQIDLPDGETAQVLDLVLR